MIDEKRILIQKGLAAGVILLSEDQNNVRYVHQNKTGIYKNPEEKVQVEAFLKLIFDYGYSPKRIGIQVPVKMGVETKQADLVVYSDDDCEQPHLLIECKKPEISEQEFLQAVEQAYSYSYALPNDVKFVWVTSGIKNEYFEVDKKKRSRNTVTDIPQLGVKRLANYKYVYEANLIKIEDGKQKFFDLITIPEEDLTKRFKQAHDALWGGGQLNPSEAFDELDKLIFCKIWDEKLDRRRGQPYDFQIVTVEDHEVSRYERLGVDDLRKAIRNLENERLSARVANLYEQGRKKDPEVFKDNIRLSPEKIRTVVGYLQDVNIGDTDLDAKGRAFETFMGSFFRGNFGQYFTPRPIVEFAVNALPITNESMVMDTSCGSGGFLLYALNKVRKQADQIYPNHKEDVRQSQKHYKFWHDFADKNLFGIEINEQISRAAKMNMIIHDDGHTNVITSDGLLDPFEIERNSKNSGFRRDNFDFIITNPPFGSIVRQTEKAYLKEYKLGKKEEDWLAVATKPETNRENQSTEILFIEQCYRFLKEKGFLAIVIPDGILTNSSAQYVRDSIEEMFRIVAVVSMPQTAFTATGAGVKSSVMFLRKHKYSTTDRIKSSKMQIQQKLIESFNYRETMKELEKQKKSELKKLENDYRIMNPIATKKEIQDELQEAKSEIQNQYAEKITGIKEELQEAYQKSIEEKLYDYPIFMAIAEEIGYDATGKKAAKNELVEIGSELQKFIESIINEEI